MSVIKVFVGRNFKPDGLCDLPDINYLEQLDIFYDERNQFLTQGIDKSNWQWYYNYIDFVHTISSKNPNARPLWLLDIGYIPIVYLPSCCSGMSTELFAKLDEKRIPYVKTQPYSFVTKYVNGLTADGWVSKMDLSKILNIPPNEITSEKVLKELVLG